MHQTWVVATLALATSCVVSSPRLGMAEFRVVAETRKRSEK